MHPITTYNDCLYTSGKIVYLTNDLEKKKYSRIVDIDVDKSKAMSGKGVACCVTAYNESGSALLISLFGLIRNFQYLKINGNEGALSESTICVIVDGVDRMSASFFEICKKFGMMDERCFDQDGDIKIFESYSDGSQLQSALLALLENDSSADQWLSDNKSYLSDKFTDFDAPNVRIIFYIKKNNAGKLDSHWHFFEVICQFLNPQYCIQMDVGTNPSIDAVLKMIIEIESKDGLAVVASRSMIPDSISLFDYKTAWQFVDMLKERIISWPVESFLGYLSVMPGQLCLMRWEAIDSRRISKVDQDFDYELSHSKVLESYYRGLENNGPFEANMFLAEDRILGFEIAHNKDRSWTIGYAHASEATTDSCNSLSELIQQRRRWICSSFACQLWFVMRVKDFVSNGKKNIKERFLMLLSTIYFIFGVLQTWFSLSVTAAVTIGLFLYADKELVDTSFSYLPRLFLFFLTTSFSIQAWISIKRVVTGNRERILSGSIIVQAFSSIGLLVLALLNPILRGQFESIFLLAAIILGLFFVNTAFYSKSLAASLLKHTFMYLIFSAWMSLFLNIFAALNVDDVSWGTKGLSANNNKPEPGGDLNKSNKKVFQRFRAYTIFAFFSSNVAMCIGLCSFPLVEFIKLLIFVNISIIFLSGLAAINVLYKEKTISLDPIPMQPE